MVLLTEYARPWESYKRIASTFEESMLHPDLIKNLSLFSKLFDQIVYNSIENKVLVHNQLIKIEDIIDTFSGTLATSSNIRTNDLDKIVIETREGIYYGFDLNFGEREYYDLSEYTKFIGERETLIKKGVSKDKSVGWFLTRQSKA